MQNTALDKNTPDISEQSQISSSQVNQKCAFPNIIGQSTKMREVFDLIQKVADCDSTILLNGETGTGKGMVARAIHQRSKRRDKPFISINCGAIPENLLESELFGHVRGAFTGATSSKQGKFELADGGTILLDEIGDMSSDLQVKVLKVLEEGEFEQVGGAKTIQVDVRIIAATHRDLSEEVQKGNFREDLYYRLYVIPMMLPALRDRRSDIPYLISHFLQYSNQKNGRDVKQIADEALAMMMNYSWPGNVRELRNALQYASVRATSDVITSTDLPPNLVVFETHKSAYKRKRRLKLTKSQVAEALKIAQGNRREAAKMLGVSRSTLYRFFNSTDDGK